MKLIFILAGHWAMLNELFITKIEEEDIGNIYF